MHGNIRVPLPPPPTPLENKSVLFYLLRDGHFSCGNFNTFAVAKEMGFMSIRHMI